MNPFERFFFSPWSLLWLALLFPVIIFFYLLKLKRRDVTVSSVLLWNHLIKDVQANAPFQKLRRNLLLLLQLLIALCAIIALARPFFHARALGGSHVVVILDGSASMQSRDGRGTRFDAARATAMRMVSDMHGGDQMMILLATSRPRRLTSFTTDRNELRRALSSARPADTTTNLPEAIILAAAATTKRLGSQIYVLSDGAFGELPGIDTQGAGLQFVRFGESANNIGIVAMDVRRGLRDKAGYQLFLAVRNHYPRPQTATLEFYRDEVLFDARSISLPAANAATGFSERAEVYDNLPEVNGILRARLDFPDDMPVDNEAYAQLSVRRDLQVLLVTEGDFYLEKALNVDPHVQISRMTPDAYAGQIGFDVTIFEGKPPARVGPGAHLYIGCGGPTAPVEIKGKVTNATIIDADRTHPAMRYARMTGVQMQTALTAVKKPWGVRLAEHEGGVAVAVGEHQGARSAYVGWSLLESDFPRRVAFPIFFNNLVQWLATSPGRAEGIQLRTGQTATLEIPPGQTTLTVTSPSGRKQKTATDGRVAYFSDTEQRGVYIAEAGGRRQAFAVNLLSREESDTRPRDTLKFGNRPVLAGSGAVNTSREIWRWLLLAAVLILAVEWWVYHRRI